MTISAWRVTRSDIHRNSSVDLYLKEKDARQAASNIEAYSTEKLTVVVDALYAAPVGDRPSEFWAGKASAAFVLAEEIKLRKTLVDALTALLKAVKAEPAMQGRQYVHLGIQVTNALSEAERRPIAWECSARKQGLPEPAECNWPTCGCDPHAEKVIAALEEQGFGMPAPATVDAGVREDGRGKVQLREGTPRTDFDGIVRELDRAHPSFNDAIEAAAKAADEHAEEAWGIPEEEWAAREIAFAIRSLKLPDYRGGEAG